MTAIRFFSVAGYALAASLWACTDAPPTPPLGPTTPIADPVGCLWALPTAAGTIADADLTELSGLALSRRHSGYLWAHNDSGNPAHLFLVDQVGKTRGRWKLSGADNVDWEDIAVGPCAPVLLGDNVPEHCVYVADTGDNDLSRKAVSIILWPEPDTLPTKQVSDPVQVSASGYRTVTVTYPDGPHNVESLAVLPDGRAVLLAKQTDGQTRIYRADIRVASLAGKTVAQAEYLGTLPLPVGGTRSGDALRATGADLTSDGRRLAVRTSLSVRVLDGAEMLALPAGPALAAQIAAWSGLVLPAPLELQGESITWDGSQALWLASEGKYATLNQMQCVP